MKRMVVLAVILTVGLIMVAPGCISKSETIPAIEKWTVVEKRNWTISEEKFGSFTIGTHIIYKNPSKENAYGAAFLFTGSDEIILKAWGNGNKIPKEADKVFVAVKTEGGKWIIGEGFQSVTFVPEIEDGKMVSLRIFLSENEDKVIRTIEFQPSLSSESEN